MVSRDTEPVTPVNVTRDFSADWVYLEILALGAVSPLNQNRTEPSVGEQFIIKLTLSNDFTTSKIEYLLGLWSFHG